LASTYIFVLFAIAIASAGDAVAAPRNYNAVPLALANFNYGNVAREQYIASVFSVFRQLDKNVDGLTAEEVDAVDQVERARRGAMALTTIYVYDLNNNGKVERAEVETVARERAGGDKDVEIGRQVDEVMTADRNRDSVIEFREAWGHTSGLIGGGYQTAPRGRELLALDPNKDGRLTSQELETLARASFAIVDLNNNGVVSSDESMAFDEATREAHNAYQKALQQR
jgi:hypothetical protein